MTAYLMIGGPKHGEVMEIMHGRRVLVPNPSWDDKAEDPPKTVFYSPWNIPSQVCPNAPADLPLMKLDELSDAAAMRALGAILRPRFNSLRERLPFHEAEGMEAFLDQIDAHGRVPPAQWRHARNHL